VHARSRAFVDGHEDGSFLDSEVTNPHHPMGAASSAKPRPYSSRSTASVRRPDVVWPPVSMLTRRMWAALVTKLSTLISSG
jgi:hypothetical protein